MSLKHRNLIALLLILLASVCWQLGQELTQEENSYDFVTTFPMEASTVVFAREDISSPPNTSESALSTQESTESLSSSVNPSSGNETFGFILCVIAAVSGASAIVLLWQREPVAGPDGLCMLVGILGTVYCILQNTAHVIGQPSAILSLLKYNGVIRVLAGCVILVALRELWGWIWARFPVSWFLLQRILKKCTLPQLSLSILVGWILLATIGILYHLFWSQYYHTTYRLSLWSFVGAMLFSLYSLWRYSTDLHHFQKQLTNYQQGNTITVGSGAFSQTESQLLAVQAQHEEALRTAITSERFKVELIANVSHDLRTPLTSILGYSELLQQETLSPEGTEQLCQLRQKAGYMSELVDSLFELTKVSSGIVEAKKEQLDLIRLLEQTIGLLDDRLTQASLVVRRNYCADSILIMTDGARMHQVFANLLGNAIKYALSGTRIYIEVKEQERDYQVRLVNTASYEMDFQPEEILQRFARGDKARSTQGSGLGLAIAQTYTDSVGGNFYVTVDGDQFSAIVELPKPERFL